MKTSAFCLLIFALFTGCKSPFDRTRDASGGGALGTFTSGGSMVVFSNELMTGGGAFLYPSGENQSLTFNDTSNPVSARSIRYAWNGQDVLNQGTPQHGFAGFDLMHTPTEPEYTSTPARNLAQAGYGRVTFFARGSLSADTLVKVEVADDGDTTTTAPCISLSHSGTLNTAFNPCIRLGVLSDSWSTYEIPVSASDLASIKDFFKATFVYNPAPGNTGTGGTVYFDQILYVP